MKKYGISRKIDELGRIVLPKEIRKNMRIRENDELLIDVLDDKIILSKAYGIESSKVLNDVVYVMHQEFDIDILISNYLPDLANALTAINEFLTLITSSIGWVLSCLGIPGTVISLLILYYTFKLTVPYLVHLIKLALKWYNTLKL